MNTDRQANLANFILALADDELILAHRHSEWTGHGPILEEDIAFTNIALDELGHARTWYGLYQQLTGEPPDTLAFFRDAADFRNGQLVELPNGDWAFSMLRQYLFDAYEQVLLAALTESSYQPLAHTAVKLRMEEVYHLRHTSSWVRRLGLGTPESHQRMQTALDVLWSVAQQLFVPVAQADGLPSMDELHGAWQTAVMQHLTASGLTIPTHVPPLTAPRSAHTAALPTLLQEMQSVARLDPTAVW